MIIFFSLFVDKKHLGPVQFILDYLVEKSQEVWAFGWRRIEYQFDS